MTPNDLLKRYLEGVRITPNDGKTTQDKADKLRKDLELNERRRAAGSTRSSGYSAPRETCSPPDFPLQPCNFMKWTKYESLPIERACFVLLEVEPPPLDCLLFEQNMYDPSPPPTWDKPPEYDNILGCLRSSIAHGNIQVQQITEDQYETQQVCWPELIRWARSKSYPISDKLEDIVAKMEPVAARPKNDTKPQAAPDAPADTVAPVPKTETAAGLSNATVVLTSKPHTTVRDSGFSTPRGVLIEKHKHHWPTIAGDIKGAKGTELRYAKADKRGWHEAKALDWARANGKLTDADKPGNAFASANSIFNSKTSHKQAFND